MCIRDSSYTPATKFANLVTAAVVSMILKEEGPATLVHLYCTIAPVPLPLSSTLSAGSIIVLSKPALAIGGLYAAAVLETVLLSFLQDANADIAMKANTVNRSRCLI